MNHHFSQFNCQFPLEKLAYDSDLDTVMPAVWQGVVNPE